MKRLILLYLSPFVPGLTELANEAGRCLIENRFAERGIKLNEPPANLSTST